MKKSDYDKLSEWLNVGGGLIPFNQNVNAVELLEQSTKGEIFTFENKTARDLAFHRCYFLLLNNIYDYLPKKFKDTVSKSNFYIWLKHLKKEYNVIFSFVDYEKVNEIIDYCLELGLSAEISSKIAAKFGKTHLVEYESISFGRMNQQNFENYVREQLPWIYENVLGKFYQGDIYTGIINTIEEDFKKFLSKL